MVTESEQLNKGDSEIFKMLADVSKQNSDSIIKQTESITKLTESQGIIVKSLNDITTTLKENVHQSDNNNPTGAGLGMEQKPKIEDSKDVGAKTKAPNAYAPGEYGSTGRGDAEPSKDANGLKMEYKQEDPKKEETKEDKPKEETKTDDKPKEEDKTNKEDKPKEETKTDDKPKEEDKTNKEEKYKSFNYDNNTTLRPTVMTKSFETYPDGYQIIKAALSGWGIEGIDADNSYVETLKRLDNYEFGSFGHTDTGGSYS